MLASTFPARVDDGTPAFVLDIAREEALSHDVTVVTPRVPNSAAEEMLDGIRILRYRYFWRRWEDLADGAILDNLKARPSRWIQLIPFAVSQWLTIRRELRRNGDPAAIHAHWLIPQGLIARLAAPHVPLLATLHGADIYALRGRLLVAIKRGTARAAQQVTVVNREMAEIVRSWGVAPQQVHVLPMGVALGDLERHRGSPRDPNEIVVVGRLVEKKGFSVLLEALRNHVSRADWHLTVIGDGPLRSELEERARELPVTFLGQRSRATVLAHLARAGLFVLPSVRAASGDREGLPVILLEAAALGTPIIASRLPGIDEVIDESSARLVEPGDAPDLGRAMEQLLSDRSLREHLGANAESVGARFSTTAAGENYRDLLARIARQRTPQRRKTGVL